jgi:lipopolysaccharide export system protein LptC
MNHEDSNTPFQMQNDIRPPTRQLSDHRDFEHLIPTVRRHSRMVRILRHATPTAGIIIILCLIAPYFSRVKLPNLSGKIGIAGTKITMDAPHTSGVTRDGREYQVSADRAVQDFTNPDLVELSGIRAKFVTKDNASVTLSAISGLYTAKLQLLSLAQRIELVSSDGKHAELSEAQIETGKGHIISKKPVKVEFGAGSLRANELEVIDSGELVRFVGSVLFKMQPAPSANADVTRSAKVTPLGFTTAQDGPVQIESSILEVRDKEHLATFKVNVRGAKGDSTLYCDTLVADYEEGSATAPEGPSNNTQKIRHLEARGGVVLTQKDQVAKGDVADFDTRANTATLIGRVSVTQGENVISGHKLVVDLNTGLSRVEPLNSPHARVESVFSPKRNDETINSKDNRKRLTPSQGLEQRRR